MPKGLGDRYRHPARAEWRTVQMPADAGVQRLLTGAGVPHEQVFNEMAAHADPLWRAQRSVRFPAEDAGVLAEEIGTVLRRARDAGDPAANALAAVARQLGHAEPAPASGPAAAPAPRLTSQAP